MSTALRMRCPLLALVLCFLVGVPAFAQMETATLSGVIQDPKGGVVPDVEVTATRIETGTSVTTKTNGAGIYFFTGLMTGHYHLIVRKPGFKEIAIKEFQLYVQDKLEQNFSLEIGSVSESVTVNADDLHINTTDASMSTVIDRNFAENLPLNGRSFQTLIQLTPGVVLTAANGIDTGQFSVNGQRASSNYWMVDGVGANTGISIGAVPGNGLGGAVGASSVLGGTNSLVSVDALQEFRIETSTFAPEFGRAPGGQISVVTRSGTNQFHGTAFDYLRNDVFDANDWFADSKGLPKARERQNDFGGTFGGPIHKDRAFFFFSYEGLRLRLPQVALSRVPCDSSCQVFGNARSMANSAMQPYLNAYPVPNGPEVFTPCTPNVNGCPASGQQPTGSAQFNASYSNPATLDAYSLRIDHAISNKVNLFGRYNYSPSELDQRALSTTSLSTVIASKVTTQTGTLGLTWSVNTKAINNLRMNYSTTDSSSFLFLDKFGGAVPLSSLPLPSPFSVKNARFGFIILSLGTSGRGLIVGDNAHNKQRQINIVDNMTLQRGSHSLKFGIDFRRLSPEFGVFEYGQTPIFLTVTSAEAGNAFRTSLTSSLRPSLLFRNLGAFAQDTWRTNSRLTLTYGVRWDVDFVPSKINGPSLEAVTGFNLRNLSNLALAPAGTPPYKTTYGNLAPRVGLAFQASQRNDWQTVIRGGFGVFYDLATSEVGNTVSFTSFPFGGTGFVKGSFPLSPSTAAPPAIAPPDASNGQSLFAIDPALQLPYGFQWNLALEQALGQKQTLTVSYIGSAARRLLQTADILSPNSNFAAALIVTNAAMSNYNALQLQFQRRLLRGFQALASYSWSHSIDTASAGSFNGQPSNALSGALDPNINRGASDFDVRHSFSAALTYDVRVPQMATLAKIILRNWSIENIFQTRSASPANIFYGSFNQLSDRFFTLVRPDVVPGQPLYRFGSQYPGGKAFNPAAFTPPPLDSSGQPTRQGNLGRNALRGFGDAQWDFAVHRDFPIRENLKLQFRAEMFNVLNHPNFGQPVADLGSPTAPNPQFGTSTQMLGASLAGPLGAGGFNPLYQIGGPRSIQFVLKLQF